MALEREVEDAITDAVGSGACCLASTFTWIVSLSFLPIAMLLGSATKAPPPEIQLIENKISPAKGAAISAIACRHCGQPNEQSQIECMSCGRSLVVYPEYKTDTFTQLQMQWIATISMAVLGIIFMVSQRISLICLGSFILISASIWTIMLIRPTVNDWQKQRARR